MTFTYPTVLRNGFEDVCLSIGNDPNEAGPFAAIEQAKAMIRDGADPFTPVSVSWGPIELDAFDMNELTLGRLSFAFD